MQHLKSLLRAIPEVWQRPTKSPSRQRQSLHRVIAGDELRSVWSEIGPKRPLNELDANFGNVGQF